MIERSRRTAWMLLTCGLIMAWPGLAADLATEIWIAPAHNTASTIGDWAVTSNGDTNFSFAVPADLGAFTGATVLLIGNQNTAADYDLALSISSDRMEHDVFRNVAEGLGPIDLVKDELLEIDVSGIFDFSVAVPPDTVDFPEDLLPGKDYVSLHFRTSPPGKGRIVGLRLRYDAAPELGGLECRDGLVAGFAADGSLICKPDNQVCPPGTVMVGFDLSGFPLCKPDSVQCADDEVLVGFTELGPGAAPICKSDQVACGRECFGGNDGTSCVSDAVCNGGTCLPTVLVGFDLRGNLDCRTLSELQENATVPVLAIVSQVSGNEGSGGGTTLFTFSVAREPGLGVGETDVVDFTVVGVEATGGASCGPGVDFLNQSGTLTFTNADCDSSECAKDIVVEVCADDDSEEDETFEVVLSPAVGGTSEIVADTGTGVIIDDDGTKPTTATLTVTITGLGGVSGPGIQCGTDCQETYTLGTVITLQARAFPGFSFAGWGGDCSGSRPILSLTMNADKNCTAIFQ